jgi:hypothetical protein
MDDAEFVTWTSLPTTGIFSSVTSIYHVLASAFGPTSCGQGYGPCARRPVRQTVRHLTFRSMLCSGGPTPIAFSGTVDIVDIYIDLNIDNIEPFHR